MKILIAVVLYIASISAFAAYPVTALPAEEQAKLLESDSPKLAANKRLAYDFYRVVMAAQWDKFGNYASKDFINHNPNEKRGHDGTLEYLKNILGTEPKPIQDTLKGLVNISAEGDFVILSFVRNYDLPGKPGEKYTSTWFDMFRIVDGKVVEHWDPAKIRK